MMPKSKKPEKPARVEICPSCGAGRLRTKWVDGRMLQQLCSDDNFSDCEWKGEPFIPEKRPIRATRSVSVGQHGGWEYEGFDQFGHIFAMSQTFSSKAACVKAARNEIKQWSGVPGYGKCTAIVWPPATLARGTRVK